MPSALPTIGDHLDAGYRLVEIHCVACRHSASIDVSEMDRAIAIRAIGDRAVCTKCGSRQCESRPDVMEFYRLLAEHTGKSHKG